MEVIKIDQYIENYSDQEAVFRAPIWGRVSFIAINVFLLWVLYLWIISMRNMIYNLKDCLEFISVIFPISFVIILLLYGSLPHTLCLDFSRGIYEEYIGIFPFSWERKGAFDDIRSVYVEQRPGSGIDQQMYQIGLVWQGGRARHKISLSGHRYRFACSETAEPAQALAQDISTRLHVPYDGLKLRKGSKLS